MSNFLAIATITAALRQVLNDAVSRDVTGATATNVRPGGESPGTPALGVNVYLYGVTPNTAWRNADLPTRRPDGQLVQRPQAALDLHYLLTFYGDDSLLETQRVLGSVVRTLHAQPTLPRAKLREVVQNNTFLTRSDMAEAVEAVRFTPITLSLEELSKLWSILFQTPYALSVAYQGTVVLIEADETPGPALPVRARNVYVTAFAQPVIEEIVVSEARPEAPIEAASTLRIRGRNLLGDRTRVRIGQAEIPPDTLGEREITLKLDSPPTTGALRAGVQGVQVVHERLLGTPPQPHPGEESNVAPIVLRPTIRKRSSNPTDPERDITFTPKSAPGVEPVLPPRITARVAPAVGRRQRAVLLLSPLSAGDAPHRIVAARREVETSSLVFDVPQVASGTYLVRVVIDGAESLLLTDADGRYVRPRVVIP